MTKSFIKQLIPLPERVEEENPNKEDDYQYPRKDRFHLMEDRNEFGRKQRPRSLEAKRKRLNISHNYFDDNDWLISEIEEELLSDDSVERKGKKKIYSLSKFSEMFKTLYADNFDEK